jgi:hypothetical protein
VSSLIITQCVHLLYFLSPLPPKNMESWGSHGKLAMESSR